MTPHQKDSLHLVLNSLSEHFESALIIVSSDSDDLRESGAIEQDADRVWFIYTPKSAMPAPQDAASVDVMLLQAKCRNGPAGIQLPITFHRRSMAFAR